MVTTDIRACGAGKPSDGPGICDSVFVELGPSTSHKLTAPTLAVAATDCNGCCHSAIGAPVELILVALNNMEHPKCKTE